MLPGASNAQGAVATDSSRGGTSASNTFFTRDDLIKSGIAIGATAVISRFDQRIQHWTQRPAFQGSADRKELIGDLTHINEGPLTLLSLATYGVGRLAQSNAIADVGLHTAESLVLTIAVSELIRVPLGRIRPRQASTGQYEFDFAGGLSRFEARSFPSLHASAAFATASALSGELRMRQPAVARYAVPVLYTAALVPGFTRLYLDEHWASDIAAGMFVGTLLGSRLVQYAHSHRTSKLDRALLGLSMVPNGAGGIFAMVNLEH